MLEDRKGKRKRQKQGGQKMRNLDIDNTITRKRTFYYRGEEDNKVVEHFVLINKSSELVVILEDGLEVASIFSKKVFSDEQDKYSVQIAGDEAKVSNFLKSDKGRVLDNVSSIGSTSKNKLETIEYDNRVYREIKATKVNCPYDLGKVKTMTYLKYNDAEVDYSESYKQQKLETLPIEALTENFLIKKKGNSYVRVYERTLLDDSGKKVKDENGKDVLRPYNFSWAKDKDYRILTKEDEILEFIEGLSQTEEIVGFDTETTGLKVHKFKTDHLVGICMSYEDNSGVYFPIDHKLFDNVEIGRERLLELLKPYCDSNSSLRKDLVLHNGGFDWKVMKMYGWDLNITHDTLILQALNRISSAKYMLGLKGIASHVLKVDTIDLGDIFYKLTDEDKSGGIMDFRYIPYDIVELYAGADADFPRLIFKYMQENWDEELNYIYNLEINTIKAVASQEYNGVRIDLDKFKQLEESAKKRLLELTDEIYEMAGKTFNIESSSQKAELFYDDLGVPKLPRFKTKSGYSTGKAVMEHFSSILDENGEKKYPIIDKIQEYSTISQKLKLFYTKIPKMEDRGHLFPSYMQMGTESGRLSSNSPNLQQTEPSSRQAMLPTSDDYYFLICDYSQVEYRLSAGLNGEKKVVDFFSNNPEADYHILAYANMMGKDYQDVSSKERSQGKILNFALSYGLQDPSLAIKLYGDDSPFYQKKAGKQREKYFDGVPAIRDNMKRIEEQAFKDGYVRTLFKRKRDIPEFEFLKKYGDKMNERRYESEKSAGARKASNTYVQGTAADIMKMAMVNCYNFFESNNLDVQIVMNVHDELCFQVNKKYDMWYLIKKIRECMEIDFSRYNIPPLYIGANVGYTWADGKADELEAPVLLMDKKGKEVQAKIDKIMEEKGISEIEAIEYLPKVPNPREVFYEDIRYFMLEVIKEEVENNGYTTVEEAYKDQRIFKYISTYFGGGKRRLLTEVFENNFNLDEVFSRLDEIEKMEELEVQEEERETKVLEESIVNVKEKAKSMVKIEKTGYGDTLNVMVEDFDKTLFKVLEELTVPLEVTKAFKNGAKKYKLKYVDTVDGLEHMYPGYLPSFFGGLLLDILIEHLTKGLVKNDNLNKLLGEKYEELADKNVDYSKL